MSYAGVTFNPRDPRTFFLGLTAGLQFNNNTYGKCFYTVVDTLSFYDYFVKDFNKLFVNYNFYQFFVYDPTHVFGNVVAVYE